MKKTSQNSFEDNLARLQAIVSQIEDDKTPIARAVELFSEGTQLALLCRNMIDEAEIEVFKIKERNGQHEIIRA